MQDDLAVNVNREDLIAYLLHQMPEEDRQAFAERWMDDAELHEALRLTEAELLDSYARGELPMAQRRRVEACLLNSERQQIKLGFARSLQDAVSRSRRRRPRWTLQVAAAIIVALAGGILWLAHQNSLLRQQAARKETAAPVPGPLYSVLLSPETREPDSPPRLQLPPQTEAVRVDLELDGGEGEEGLSAVLSLTGRAVWTVRPIQIVRLAHLSVARVWIPSHILQPGEYSIELLSNGTPAGSYRFRVEPAK
jgi:hypothetical protein